MYNTSQNYKNYIKEPSRMFESKIVLADRTFTNDDVIQLKTELQQPSNGFTLGSCISKSLELTLKNDGGTYASVGVVNVSLGLKMGELIEYIPQGIFNIDTVEKTDYTVKITAYDNMIKFETAYSEKYDNPTLKQVIQQLQDITGVEFDSSVTIPSYTLSKLSGYTCREILGYVASLMGGNAYITRDGKFTIVTPVEVDYTVTSNNYWDYDLEDNTYKIGMLTCQNKLKNDAVDESDDYEAIEEKNTISAGSLGTDSMELTFVNPWMTETILNSVYNKLKSFSFLGYSMKWQGDLSLDVGNIINVTDKHGVTRKAFVYSDKLNYNGGLTQGTGAKGQTKSSNEFSTTDSPTELDRISVKVLLAEKAIIQKANISDLTAVSAKVGTLDVSIANINTALINYAKVDDLNATNANVSNLTAQYSNLSNAIINKANIADLNAATANISKLQSTVADISTLVNGNLTSANIQSLVLTADKVTVQNGFIKNAMIESLAADKITAGTLSTNKLTIKSSDGGLVMSNNTIQFSDKDKNVRVQIGQDAKGDFNFIVKGTDGKTVLLDSTGLHEGAISDGLIKTDMIADNSINSNKIDYQSVISGLNADGSNYINASKVAIDLTGQTLDIAFNSVKSTADSANSKIDNLSVGGRNLILGSKTFLIDSTQSKGWHNDGMTITKDTGTDNYIASCKQTGKTSNTWTGIYSNYIPIAKTDIFTVSFDIKVEDLSVWDQKGLCILELYGTENGRKGWHDFYMSENAVKTKTTLTDNEWCRVYVTIDMNTQSLSFLDGYSLNDMTRCCIRLALTRNGSISFKCAKYENGNIATDWTPAPEDTDSSIESIKTITENNTTYISAIQGQISTLISNTTVTVDGKEKTLKDAYNGTVQKVNSINTTIGEHTSTLNALNGTVSSNSSKITSIQTDLNGIKTSVSSVQNDLNSTKSQLSSLSTTLDGFESRVEATENNLNNLSVGGRNLLTGTSVEKIRNVNSPSTFTTFDPYTTFNKSKLSDLGFSIGDELSISFEWEISQNGSLSEIYGDFRLEWFGITTDGIDKQYLGLIKNPADKFSSSNKKGKVSLTTKISSNNILGAYAVRIRIDNSVINFKVSKMKLEKGNIATDWTPAPEDLESYTDTQIANAKSEIKQTTDSISQSVSNINSSITTINNTLGNKAEKSTVESISNSVASLNTSISGITGRVSSLETNTTTLTTKLNNLSVGGRNLILGSGTFTIDSSRKKGWHNSGMTITKDENTNNYIAACSKTGLTSNTWSGVYSNYIPISKTDVITISFDMKIDDLSTWDLKAPCILELYNTSKTRVGWHDVYMSESITKTTLTSNTWCRVIVNVDMNTKSFSFLSGTSWADVTDFGLRLALAKNGKIYFKCAKIENGNQATDWTPAPEDVDQAITTVKETVTSNTSEISALKNSISLKVDSSTLTSYKETVNGQISTINSSISSMQSSIDLQLDSIKSSVSKTVSTKNLINNSAFKKPLGTYSTNGTVKMCEIVPKSTYTSWGNATPPVASDNVLIVRFDVGGDNYVNFKDIFAKVKPSTTYTFSYYCNSSGNITGPSSYLYERTASQSNQIVYTNAISIGPDTTSINKGWVRKTTSFTTRSDTDSVMVRFGFHSTDGATRILVAGLQLEEGSQATDWVEGNTSSIGTVITQSPTDIMTAFNGISKYFEVSANGAKFGNIATGDYMAFNDRGLVRYIANQEKRYIYMVQPRTFKKTLNNQTPALTSAQSSVGKTTNWDDMNNNMPKAKDYAQTFTLTFDNELINLLSGYAPQYATAISTGFSNPSNLSYTSKEDYLFDSYIEVVSMTATSITFKAARICCVYEITTDKTGLIKYYQYKRNYAGGTMNWNGLIFA